MKVYVGCCGFPVGMQRYFQEFSVVELQSTFYKIPKLGTARKWRERAPRDFQFLAKVFQAISHPVTSPTWRRSGLGKEELERMRDKVGFLRPTKEVFVAWNKNLEICKVLGAKACLIQLPASFQDTPENFINAKKFFSKIERDGLEIAVELRGWKEESIAKICKKFNLIHCTDPFASLPTHFGKSKIGYFRLHGSYEKGRINYKYKYTEKDLKWLVEKIKELSELSEVYCLLNNVWMYENALQLQNLLK